jgi:hypothetical protein
MQSAPQSLAFRRQANGHTARQGCMSILTGKLAADQLIKELKKT